MSTKESSETLDLSKFIGNTFPVLTTEEQDFLDHEAKTYDECLPIARRLLLEQRKLGLPIIMNCGPMTTGGTSRIKNMSLIRQAIQYYRSHGLNIFDQCIFEKAFLRIKAQRKKDGLFYRNYDYILLKDFYGKLFEERLIDILYFLQGYEKSIGSLYEEKKGYDSGLKMYYISPADMKLISKFTQIEESKSDYLSIGFVSATLEVTHVPKVNDFSKVLKEYPINTKELQN